MWDWERRHGWWREFCRLCTSGVTGLVFVALAPVAAALLGGAIAVVVLECLAAVSGGR